MPGPASTGDSGCSQDSLPGEKEPLKWARQSCPRRLGRRSQQQPLPSVSGASAHTRARSHQTDLLGGRGEPGAAGQARHFTGGTGGSEAACRAQAPQRPGQGRGCVLSASPQSLCLLPTHTLAPARRDEVFSVGTDPAQRRRHHTTELAQRVNRNEAGGHGLLGISPRPPVLPLVKLVGVSPVTHTPSSCPSPSTSSACKTGSGSGGVC